MALFRDRGNNVKFPIEIHEYTINIGNGVSKEYILDDEYIEQFYFKNNSNAGSSSSVNGGKLYFYVSDDKVNWTLFKEWSWQWYTGGSFTSDIFKQKYLKVLIYQYNSYAGSYYLKTKVNKFNFKSQSL